MKLFICVVLCIFSSLALSNTSLPSNRHISVTGSAQMLAMPDIAVVYLNVESEQKSSLAAKKEVDERVNNLLNGLPDFDVDEKNVSASNISTEVRYAYNRDERDKIEGYLARRTLTVTLKNIEKLNAFMDFALRVKINAIRNIELKSSNEKQLQQEVNVLAVEHAKSRGQSLAKAFGVNLGAIYSINANSTQIHQRYGANNEGYKTSVRMANSSAKPGRYLQESMVFSASISVVFDLEL
ncbi:SIMPL domain-containing protein [Colwellia sp. MB02u-10]|uniref:SIMPL domain-containing protein n=1 Tax=Colwellia sp. MB02u-10 TaxID=2759828 RepID=UPI0015F55C49|nr:SIMPL domain-containing protein [Colwellia sp. MB02u-10]MBA6340149.1 SIMPL domain-containing protein [Colwellia sp. MB02u-10]